MRVPLMSADLNIAGKALAAACTQVREGTAEDSVADGVTPAFVASPGDTGQAAAVMRVAAEHELAVVARGGGSRLGWGVPPSRCDLVIETSLMGSVLEHAAGDLVARVQAGARLGDVAAALAEAGQEIALDVPADATIGGMIGSGLAGPRRLRYGTPRDLLIGITIVRADGTVAKSGGKVVKNVAGYDLGKLMAGAAGTLGLVTEATFRLHPLPAARAYVTAEYVAVSVACDAVAVAANSPLVPSAVELIRPTVDGPILVGVLLEGSADGVAARAARMSGLLGTAEVTDEPPDWWPGAPSAAADGETLIQVSFWVSALGGVLDAIESAAAKADVSPVIIGSAGAGVLYAHVAASEAVSSAVIIGSAGAGVLYAHVAASEAVSSAGASAGAVAEFAGALRAAAGSGRGGVTVLAAPAAVRAELASRGGLYGTVPGLALMRAVKDQFDPGHRLAPGRFPEGT
jgi:glycolate oxidase FAD binding subunit